MRNHYAAFCAASLYKLEIENFATFAILSVIFILRVNFFSFVYRYSFKHIFHAYKIKNNFKTHSCTEQ